MKVAIIGTGRVGGATAFCLAENKKIDKITLINRTKERAKGLKMDLMGTFPELGDKILVGDLKDANDSDICLITCGLFTAPTGDLIKTNELIIEDIFKKVKLKKDAKLIVITTPPDKMVYVAWKLSGLDSKNVIGFGGQLDANRLRYIIYSDKKDLSKIECHFIGEHGKRGLPIFREKVTDRERIVNLARNYFKLYLSSINTSTYGTARELAKLVDALMSEEKSVFDISYYEEKYGIFITWPCLVNRNGVIRPLDLDLTNKEKKGLESLINERLGSD